MRSTPSKIAVFASLGKSIARNFSMERSWSFREGKRPFERRCVGLLQLPRCRKFLEENDKFILFAPWDIEAHDQLHACTDELGLIGFG